MTRPFDQESNLNLMIRWEFSVDRWPWLKKARDPIAPLAGRYIAKTIWPTMKVSTVTLARDTLTGNF